jgi:S-adenosylmethionine-diacylgycerolhomoserine-N-methlytransferase
MSGLVQELRILGALLRGKRRSGDHGADLEAFYAAQAEGYDRFRERLLHGRGELLAALPLAAGARFAEFGAGTGRNLEYIADRVPTLGAAHLVDLCPSLLDQARRRCRRHGWSNVACHVADVTTWSAPEPLDVVLCSYALTMIPDWQGAIANAVRNLRPGGVLAVVDFFISAPRPPAARARHGAAARWFWPRWFGHDGVHPDPRHLDALFAATAPLELVESTAPVPWLAGLRAPFYRYLGRVRG